ncbi:hypothetical protein B0H13DRAFT_1872717 [Mycena leptocephala]|nr:hypothetical protein B0H13DRAFT_1872717 [Mycena leptocephala]
MVISDKGGHVYRPKQDGGRSHGGTLGIGTGVPRLLAKLGNSRKATLAVLQKLAPKESKIVVEFIKGDLSDGKGMRTAASSIQEAAGNAGMDYLIMSQNGTPAWNQSRRDSVVLESFFEEFNLRYPQYHKFSLFPGAHRLPFTRLSTSITSLMSPRDPGVAGENNEFTTSSVTDTSWTRLDASSGGKKS